MRMNTLWCSLAFTGCKALIVLIAIALFVGSTGSGNAFAATITNHTMANSRQIQTKSRYKSSKSRATPLDCFNPYDKRGNGYNYLHVPGGVIEISDNFHYTSCDFGTSILSVDYNFDGNVSTDWSSPSNPPFTRIDLSSTITLNGLNTTINLPPGANFNLTSSNIASHTDTQASAISDGFTYNGLTGTATAPLGVIENDTATYYINGQSYQVSASVSLNT